MEIIGKNDKNNLRVLTWERQSVRTWAGVTSIHRQKKNKKEKAFNFEGLDFVIIRHLVAGLPCSIFS